MAFVPDGRLLFTEKNTGNVRVVQGGILLPTPWATVRVSSSGERGLLGITVDPNFVTNRFVYVYHTNPSPLANRVIRFRDSLGRGVDSTVILTAPITTGATNHNGGNLHFGPDDKLYVTIGEYANPLYSQDLRVVMGKILRLNRDGTAPPDNPFYNDSIADKRIYCLGLRNSFDFAFDSLRRFLWATENGPTCDDELNLIRGEETMDGDQPIHVETRVQDIYLQF